MSPIRCSIVFLMLRFLLVWSRMTEEATSGDASPPNVKTMSLIARQAFEIDEYVRISDILHKR